LTPICELHIIELPKLERLIKNREIKKSELTKWISFLLAPEKLEVTEMKDNEALKKAKQELEEIRKDEHERELAFQRMVYMMDQEAIREGGFDEGMEKGLQKGKEEIAKKLLKKGSSIEDIIDITGLTLEEIENLNIV